MRRIYIYIIIYIYIYIYIYILCMYVAYCIQEAVEVYRLLSTMGEAEARAAQEWVTLQDLQPAPGSRAARKTGVQQLLVAILAQVGGTLPAGRAPRGGLAWKVKGKGKGRGP